MMDGVYVDFEATDNSGMHVFLTNQASTLDVCMCLAQKLGCHNIRMLFTDYASLVIIKSVLPDQRLLTSLIIQLCLCVHRNECPSVCLSGSKGNST